MMNTTQSPPEEPKKSNEAGKSVPDSAQNKQSELEALMEALQGTSDSKISGSATVSSGAGTAEATLLGSIALHHIAHKIAKALLAEKLPERYILATSKKVPDFRAIYAYEAKLSAIKGVVYLLNHAYDRPSSDIANAHPPLDDHPSSDISNAHPPLDDHLDKKNPPPKEDAPKSIPVIGPALTAVSDILSYAKTDYQFASLDITADDAMLLRALAGKLAENHNRVEIPEVYAPDVESTLRNIISEIISLKTQINVASSSDDSRQKGESQKPLSETLDVISKSFDTWVQQLIAPDDKGNSPIATISLQKSIKEKLGKGAVLVILELHSIKGDSYTKKSLWSSLGANPFFVMGGALASYIVLDGKEGKVLGSQLLPRHGGYHSVSDIEKIVNHDDTTR